MVHTMNIQEHTSTYKDIHGIYHEHHSILHISKAEFDAIVYERNKSPEFPM